MLQMLSISYVSWNALSRKNMEMKRKKKSLLLKIVKNLSCDFESARVYFILDFLLRGCEEITKNKCF